VKIMVVDDHEVVRLGLKGLFERQSGWQVVAEASTADEAVSRALEYRPDVVVMDIRLAGSSGIEACQRITSQAPEIRVIMLTSYAEDDLLFDAIAAGAAGYVLKQIGSDELVRAIETVGRGEALLDPSLTRRVLARVREADRREAFAAFADLTEQELRVLALISEGKTNREIAEALYLGEGTVRNYVSNILGKLGVSNRAEAAAYAVENNLKDHMKLDKP
jgi:two-component system response regulator DevR